MPYIAAHPVEFQTIEDWQNDARGLTPVEATMMVAIPELDGAIAPMTFGGRSQSNGGSERDMASHPERADMLVPLEKKQGIPQTHQVTVTPV